MLAFMDYVEQHKALEKELRQRVGGLLNMLTRSEKYNTDRVLVSACEQIALLLVQTEHPPGQPIVGVLTAKWAVGEWIEFVRKEAPDYIKRYPSQNPWPTFPDPSHSSLLERLMLGEKPLPKEEYEAAKKKGKV
jgi:hypothetical protein